MKMFEVPIATLTIYDVFVVVPVVEGRNGELMTNWSALKRMGMSNAQPGPLKASSYSWVRRDYASCIAREEGALIAGVQLDPDLIDTEEEEISTLALDIIRGSGIEIQGVDWPVRPSDGRKCGWMRYMTQAAKSNNAVLPVVDFHWAKRMEAMFPDAGDAVRPGALHTPLRGGYFRVTARVLVCEDDDPRFTRIGDGQGLVDRAWAAQHKVVFENDPQFRAVLHLDNEDASKWILGKGTLIPARLPDGVDLVMPRGTLKHNKGIVLSDGVHEIMMGFGIVNGDEDLAGPILIGPQVTQWASSEVVNKAHNLVSAKLSELRERLSDVRWLAGRGTSLRDEEGNLQQFDIIKLFAAVCVAIGDTRLMRSKMMVAALTEWVATAGYQILAGLGIYAWRFRAVCNRELGDNVVAINPKVFQHLFGLIARDGVDTIAIRYPFAYWTEMVAIIVHADPRVRWYEAWVNERTMNRAALDFDGDAFAIARPDEVVVEMRKTVEGLPISEEKLRQKAKPPTSRSKMIAQSMAAGIGLIDYVIQKWVVIMRMVAHATAHADEKIGVLRVELQKAVDSVKKAATPDMQLVRKLSKEAQEEYGITLSMHAYRQLQKRKNIKPFTLFEGTERQAEEETLRFFGADTSVPLVVEPGKPIMPSRFFGHADTPDEELMPLAAFIRAHEDEVPLIQLSTLDNKFFAGWIEEIPGEGFQWANKAIDRLYKRMGDIANDLKAKKITLEMTDMLRAELFEAYRKVWRDKAVEMNLGKENENTAWLESAASALWAAFSRGDNAGFAMKFALPEVVARMLIARKDSIAEKRAEGAGMIGKIMGGLEFRAKCMNDDTVYTAVEVVDTSVETPKYPLSVRVGDGQTHGMVGVVVPTGMHHVKLASVPGIKSVEITFTGKVMAEFFEIPLDGDTPEPEWADDGSFDYASADDGVVETDVM